MQNWNNQIRKQLNNLPGFPPVPTGTPPGTPSTPYEWILGDWIDECRVRPGVSVLGALPTTGNEVGDVRFVVGLGAWYWWDGAAWQLVAGNGAVDSVTASAPLSSSGGGNPDISFPSWPANASGALTNDGAGNLSWAAPGGTQFVTFPSTVSSSSTLLVEAGSVKLPFVVSAGAVGCECAVFSTSLTRARVIAWNLVGSQIGSFVEAAATTGLRIVTPVFWPSAFTGWARITIDQIHTPTAAVSLRGVFFVES
jgi:hypothetical protein